MDPFSYICVLTSIVTGLAVTRLVGGFGQLMQTRKRTPTYWVHTLWMANTLIAVIITWWVQYRWRNAEQWTLLLFVWLLVPPTVLYLAAALLFPNEQEGERITDWRKQYYAASRGFFLFFASTFVIDVVDTLLKGVAHYRSIGPAYPILMVSAFSGSAIAAFTTSPRYHQLFALAFFVYSVGSLSSNLLRLL